MMASLRHPSIVMYLGVCLDPPAVVTEYCARGERLLGVRGAVWAVEAPTRGANSTAACPFMLTLVAVPALPLPPPHCSAALLQGR
jgi:hypothetical protein